jgi:HSP20 family molecular chaperone IbpA
MFKTETSVIDNEFSSIRERFDREMSRMEDEMASFRNKMLEKESEWFQNSLTGFPSLSPSAFNSSNTQHHSSSSTNQQLNQKKHVQQTSTSSTQQSKSSSSNLLDRQGSNSGAGVGSWINSLDSPLVHDSSDGKVLKLRFDVTQYAPEEIVVKTVDNKLQVNAKHEENSENRSVFREYKREFLLPQGVNPELIRSSLSKDGVLTVEAPLPAIEDNRERRIPIGPR